MLNWLMLMSLIPFAAVHWTQTGALPGLIAGVGLVGAIFLVVWLIVRWLGAE